MAEYTTSSSNLPDVQVITTFPNGCTAVLEGVCLDILPQMDATLHFSRYEAIGRDFVHFDIRPCAQTARMRMALEQNARV